MLRTRITGMHACYNETEIFLCKKVIGITSITHVPFAAVIDAKKILRISNREYAAFAKKYRPKFSGYAVAEKVNLFKYLARAVDEAENLIAPRKRSRFHFVPERLRDKAGPEQT